MQNVPYFHLTLAEPIKQDPGEFCLIDPIVQQVWFFDSNSLTNSRSAEGWREKDDR